MQATILTSLAVIAFLAAPALAGQSSSTKSFNVKVGKTKKTATCDFSVSYTMEADGSATINSRSASCSINWPKSSALNFKTDKSFMAGDPLTGGFNAVFSITIKKSKNKPASQVSTQIRAVAAEAYSAGSLAPAELAAGSWEDCAQHCSEYTNEAGNAPCFTWSWDSGSDAALGLSSGSCRLLAFMDAVSTISVAGVYSG